MSKTKGGGGQSLDPVQSRVGARSERLSNTSRRKDPNISSQRRVYRVQKQRKRSLSGINLAESSHIHFHLDRELYFLC